MAGTSSGEEHPNQEIRQARRSPPLGRGSGSGCLWISFSPELCLLVQLGQQICQPQTMASFCRQWSAGGMSQEGRAQGGTIRFQDPVAKWVLQGGPCCHQGSLSSKAPFIGPAAPETRGLGQQWDHRRLTHRCTGFIGLPGAPETISPARQTLFNEKTNSYSQIRPRPAAAFAAPPAAPSLGLPWLALQKRKGLFISKGGNSPPPGEIV